MGNTPRTFAVGVMSAFRSQRVDTWDICSRDLVSRHSRFRLRRYARSPFIYVRELAQGKQVPQEKQPTHNWNVGPRCQRQKLHSTVIGMFVIDP